MMCFRLVVGIFLLLPLATHQISQASSPSYIAAVAEYSPIKLPENNVDIALNAENFVKFIAKAADLSADIVIFPESGLNAFTNDSQEQAKTASYTSHPDLRLVACNNATYATYLQMMSCTARQHKIYVVVNHREKVDCTPSDPGCRADGLLLYNTNVGFDREGRLIARYRKTKLFDEPGNTVPLKPEYSIFQTDFGVTFGQFICFDILFAEPALDLVRKHKINDIIFTSHWYSELPFLYSLTAQAGWAYANDANLLASGYNDPKTASGGSGIHIGRNGYSGLISLRIKPTNALVVSEVPKVIDGHRSPLRSPPLIYEFNSSEIRTSEDQSHGGGYSLLIDDLKIYTTKAIGTGSTKETLCDRDFCCEFEIDADLPTNSDHYRYRLAVFNGTRTFGSVTTGGIMSCGLISCRNDSLASCGELYAPTAVIASASFRSVKITTQQLGPVNGFFMPVSLTKNMLPLNATDYSYQSAPDRYSLELTKPISDLLTFAIYGRNFDRDGGPVTTSSTARN